MAKAHLLAALSMFPLAALTWAQSTTGYTLRGSVVNAVTGEPIHKAFVFLNGPQTKTLTTGPDGQFEMDGLQAGTYSVNANRPGFADSRMAGTPLAPVQVGADTTPVTIKLIPFGRIAGRVIDADGEPVPNLSVQAMYRALQMGHVTWPQNAAANTDENGNFVLDALQPGQYVIAVREQQVYPGLAGDDRASRLIYHAEYFPNSPDMASAQPIELSGGETAQADLIVSEVQGSAIHFATIPPQQWLQVTLRDANGDETNVPVRRDDRSGAWTIAGISPGRWLLQVQSNIGNQLLSGSAALEVGDTDARNVAVALSAAGQIPVVFSGESNAKTAAPPANLSLISSSGPGIRPYSPIQSVDPGGAHYSIAGIPPGTYHAQVGPNGSQCLESITSGSSDLSRVDYVMPENGAPQPIDVNVGADCSTINFSPTRKTGTFFFVVVAGGVYAREPLMLIGGDTVSTMLAPGEYDVYAFPDANKVEYANPEVLRNYTSRHISVSGNQTASFQLDLNKAESK